MEPRKCAHAVCECEIDPLGSNYCSPSCEQDAAQGADEADGCRCGHSGCGVDRIPVKEDLEQHA